MIENCHKSEYVVTGPVSRRGGIASFVNNMVPCLRGKTVVFQRGSSASFNRIAGRIVNSVGLPFRFVSTLRKTKAPKILINSSLSIGSMLRDGLLVRISKSMHRKTILFVHGFREEDLRYGQVLKWGYFRADKIIVLAGEFKDLLIEAGYKSQIEVSLNPIDDRLFQQTTTCQLKKNLTDILFLSRVEKEKGIFEALECFEILKKKHPELVFNVAGDGSAKKDAERFVADRNIQDVIFHGFTTGDDKIKLLNGNTFLLFPTHREGLPITILEAMAAGVIVLTRPVGGIKDLYARCNFGAMIESTSPEEFAEAFERLSNDVGLCKTISDGNREFSKTHFHPGIVAGNIENMFDSI